MPVLKSLSSKLICLGPVFFYLFALAGCSSREPEGQASSAQSSQHGAGSQAAKQQQQTRALECRRAKLAIAIDGKIEEWQDADTMRLDDPADIPDPNRQKIYTLWDEKYLYIAYEVQDHYLVGFQSERDHRALYKDDMIEVLLDPREDATDLWLEDDIVYHINVLGQVKDDRGTPEGKSDADWQSEALFAVTCEGTLNDSTDLDTGFSVELAIPWTEIGKTPSSGVTLGINFAAGDAEGEDDHLWDWCGAHPFRQPSVYGKLILK